LSKKNTGPSEPVSSIFEVKRKINCLGQGIQPKRDLTRYVKWPQYVRLQRQRAILKKRLKIPPTINQFNSTLDKNTATQALRPRTPRASSPCLACREPPPLQNPTY
jgi:large subunit ribosomal protein L7Ae